MQVRLRSTQPKEGIDMARFRQLVTVIYEVDLSREEMIELLTKADPEGNGAESMSDEDLAVRIATTANDNGQGQATDIIYPALTDAAGDWSDTDDVGDWVVV